MIQTTKLTDSDISKNFILKYIKEYLYADVLILAVAYVAFFNQLGHLPLFNWDEGIYATNVLEMHHNGNYLVKYFWGSPEMWGTQPPLVAWLQLLSANILGFNEFGYRFPSAVAGFLTVVLVIHFCSTELKSRYVGYLSALVLMTSTGFVSYHVTRTADLDAIMVFFVSAYTISFFKYLKYQKTRFFIASFVCVTLAYFSKTVAGLIMLLPLFMYVVYARKLKYVFSRVEMYIGIFVFAVIVIVYYFLRERVNPGYIKAAWNNEIATRLFVVNEGHEQPLLYYIELLWNEQFQPWIAFVPLSLSIFLIKKEMRDIAVFILFMFVFFLLVISISSTKICWYTAPLFPFLAIIVGYGLYSMYSLALLQFKNYRFHKIVYVFVVLAFFYFPVVHVFNTYNEYRSCEEEKLGNLVEKLQAEYPSIKSMVFYSPYFAPSAYYYARYYNVQHGWHIRVLQYENQIPIHEKDTIAFSRDAVAERLNTGFHYRTLLQHDDIRMVIVDSVKR